MTPHRRRILGREDARAMSFQHLARHHHRLGRRIECGSEMLARMAAALLATVMREHLVVELIDDGQLRCDRWRFLAPAGRDIAGELAGPPRTPLRRAPDHDRIGAGSSKRLRRILAARDVAVHHHRNGYTGLDRAYGGPVGAALIELAARSPVH